MSDFDDLVRALHVRVVVPGTGITATLTNHHELVVEFPLGAYDESSERALERHMAAMARLVCAARIDAYDRMIATMSDGPAWSDAGQEERDIIERLAQLTVSGESSDGRVRFETQGMRSWSVTIADGTVRALNEFEFAQRVGEAAGRVIDEWFQRGHAVRAEVLEEYAGSSPSWA
ncbi:MAG: hypothetical protein HOV77_16060 [Hamadaea sp.]|uniref:hypothetical protein n=1 Tax=Hamadaea sp. TaxID=2024425 RepID=UPI001817073A|nr:hypothetical protein [Hamadaea sp.]NUT20698.1 hypothetical protein [Hamadaea sp.]